MQCKIQKELEVYDFFNFFHQWYNSHCDESGALRRKYKGARRIHIVIINPL